ncbi:hypothetical protein [Thermomonospora umbrina]|uniref:A-factor biosynthesis hotdog protein n=1 Tax=Thermomonospora umbrina TaxID=111806 RepID=A0A3D9SXX5_9ACTN|nr:hypothetical protein [Thermomonospora umbrina]REF00418.1 A-factor biosynthesis hotdog protein [Thermomonospora umbrina]
MPVETVMVIGDHYRELSHGKQLVTASELLARLVSTAPTGLRILVGQGLTESQLTELVRLVDRAGASVALCGPVTPPAVYGPSLGSAAIPALVGRIERIEPDRFVAPLRLDERLDVLDDERREGHLTALVVLEVARHMWVATTEKFLLLPDQRNTWVIGGVPQIRSAFHQHLFPFPARVECRLIERESQGLGQMLSVRVAIHQGGVLAAQVQTDLRLLPKAVAQRFEGLALRKALSRQLTVMDPTGQVAGTGELISPHIRPSVFKGVDR